MSAPRILFVDDDSNLLEASRRVLKGGFEILTALGGEEGLRTLREQGPFAVVVSDLRMPVIDGITLLKHVREASPETVRVLLTGHADSAAAIQAVNDGQIFRFLTKPCPGSVIRDALRDAARQYQLQTAERVLTQQTLRGCVRALVEMISIVHPAVAARTSRVRRLVVELSARLDVPEPWSIEVAALLSHVGYIGMPAATVDRLLAGQPLSSAESARAKAAPEIAAKLIASIPRMEDVQNILLMQATHWNGAHAVVAGMREGRIPIGARVLRVAIDYDTLTQRGTPVEQALSALDRADGVYDPDVLDALQQCRAPRAPEPDTVAVRIVDLQSGMIFSEDLRTSEGMLVVARGQEVSEQLLTHIQHYWDEHARDAVVHVHFADEGDLRAA